MEHGTGGDTGPGMTASRRHAALVRAGEAGIRSRQDNAGESGAMPDASGTAGGEAALRRRADELSSVHWHHSIRLFPDLVTRGAKSPDQLSVECASILEPLDLRGRSVLDIGAWNGYFAFEAARRGAARPA